MQFGSDGATGMCLQCTAMTLQLCKTHRPCREGRGWPVAACEFAEATCILGVLGNAYHTRGPQVVLVTCGQGWVTGTTTGSAS